MICISECKPSNVLCRSALPIADQQKRFADLFSRMQISKGSLLIYIRGMSVNFQAGNPTYSEEGFQSRKDDEFGQNQRKKPDSLCASRPRRFYVLGEGCLTLAQLRIRIH